MLYHLKRMHLLSIYFISGRLVLKQLFYNRWHCKRLHLDTTASVWGAHVPRLARVSRPLFHTEDKVKLLTFKFKWHFDLSLQISSIHYTVTRFSFLKNKTENSNTTVSQSNEITLTYKTTDTHSTSCRLRPRLKASVSALPQPSWVPRAPSLIGTLFTFPHRSDHLND